ncbi:MULTISPECIES: hypothetical protein [Staphylococcus]|jgi:hypothetical protein|uniref:Uncharacterized protein n=1 Tax=Staphylococcus nepalensis TaxID=214473 RepID=A0A291JHT3_9STAP|nr:MULTISPECIES: hypothetical protein [Staphylococcus]NWN86068.1 hypothetical protein [Staphylococcus sp.]VDG65815.1 Uncharacterised protein [Lacrimispora indolis]ATH58967.1 hypothetical protein BJD96_00725 [Staphylococcus nepalensis]ATH64058.1 hypothetical protein BJG89_01070 [Staphylococcus nepalensis]AWI43421.1 hypothetical protein BJG88_00785 [Staphylococcus nepalensis]
MIRFVYIILLFFLVFCCYKIAHFIVNKFNFNRWVLLVAIPFIIVVPVLIFEKINILGWGAMLFLLIFASILFFEKSRVLIDKRQMRGILYKSDKE